MSLRFYQVDAFTSEVFQGNPAGVCPLESWLPDGLMQNIAMENNLAETAFYVPTGDRFGIRWFTPAVEVDLCGHATLAAAYVIFRYDRYPENEIALDSRSGILRVRRDGDLLTLDFPVDTLRPAAEPAGLSEALGARPREIFRGKTDCLAVFGTQAEIEAMRPDFGKLGRVEARGVIVTARGTEVDFISRFFGPQVGIDEDPVTGSAHTSLAPYWAEKLGKTEMEAVQLSRRGGRLKVRLRGDRVDISGRARAYLEGRIEME
ncbi:MAG TPA: PhzF family phenazine biosynthesis protein [Candidatus Aminicenantes bacterium]|nr:PhzF family phenazine biosynthesis protein [Candidatus Aminicenantes bacterium]HOY97880.1 PhzF family phenazine biosynthesis protein [Candidatus Aminicenantes bacterium]HQF96934.1 PhzF family phenazine biosynthesis protein [Candidatus Aminicenantes bacterium]HQH44645.1 PhzF family phenazine biosynthesis protein [Candidatus Aminicenantes bacterium]HQJ42452.1 PhzF family phenazine biosynthesis protein [Candidatus Aminicenantes bacterium]